MRKVNTAIVTVPVQAICRNWFVTDGALDLRTDYHLRQHRHLAEHTLFSFVLKRLKAATRCLRPAAAEMVRPIGGSHRISRLRPYGILVSGHTS